MHRILFVCAGNTCRSVLAEYIARRRFPQHLQAASAGMTPGPMADAANAIYTLKQVGIDATAHEPRDVRTFDLGAFDTIISMDNHVGRALNALFPHLPANLLLKWRVNDPYGDDLPEYRHCAELIHKEIKRFVAVLDRKEMGPNNAFHSDGSRAARENRR